MHAHPASPVPPHRSEARQAADRLREKLAEAGGEALTLDAERVERLAALLDRLGGRDEPVSEAPVPSRDAAANWAPANRVEQDLAALLMRSAARGKGSDTDH